jgi:hypothetical protein
MVEGSGLTPRKGKVFIMLELLCLGIIFGGTALIIFMAWGIAEIIHRIQTKRANNFLARNPEVIELIKDYMAKTDENFKYVDKQLKLEQTIRELEERNKYLPSDRRLDDVIERTKEEHYQNQEEKENTWEIRKEAERKLDQWYDDHNTPDRWRFKWVGEGL